MRRGQVRTLVCTLGAALSSQLVVTSALASASARENPRGGGGLWLMSEALTWLLFDQAK
ncbi:unnamed protein product, partial [Gadus morhua 'NCC']